MILTIDIGNSNIVSIVYDDLGNKVFLKRENTLKEVGYQEYYTIFDILKEEIGLSIEAIALSCVVPSMQKHITNSLMDVFGVKVDMIQTSKVRDLKVSLDNPDELGADYVATAVGAHAKYHQPVIIVDMGSATKIGVIDESLNFLGGVIQPGIGSVTRALKRDIPHLPDIELIQPKSVLGRDTIECIQSGIVNGALASVIELSNQIEHDLNIKCIRILTGGYANLYHSCVPFIHDESLLNDGLFHYLKGGYSYE